MKVLSVRQPYAALLVCGAKRLEARGWSTRYRGPLLIHASSSAISATSILSYEFEPEFIAALDALGWRTKEALRGLPRSAIIGQVTLDDVVPSLDLEDAPSRDIALAAAPDEETFFWRVKDAVAIEPVTAHGKLNLWELPADLEGEVKRRLAEPHSLPTWTAPVAGTPLQVRLVNVSPMLARLIGPETRSRRAVWSDLFNYLDANDLIRGQSVEINEDLAGLFPGRKRVRLQTLAEAVSAQLSGLDEGE